MSKIFGNKLRKRFLVSVLFIALVNVFSLILWYGLRIRPMLVNVESIGKTILSEELKSDYSSFNSLVTDLKNITQEYKIKFQIKNLNNEIIKSDEIAKSNFQLFSDVLKAGSEVYVVNAYISNDFGPTRIVLSLILFQIIIISVLMFIIYKFTGYTIIAPIEKIINDIKNYKFGKKPVIRKFNNELDTIQREFSELVDSLENQKLEQKRIIASISHDIKTPLTSIIGYSSLMEDNLSKEETKKYSSKIHEKAIHIKDILSGFDDYLVNYDNKKLKLDEIVIKDLINELNDDYKIDLNNKNIEFNVTSNCEKEKIKIYILKIKRVFSNIISNSIRYVPKHGVININIEKKNKNIKFVIKDNGTGINENIIDKVFDPFFTTDSSRKISGLGLSICKEFIELHGGKIRGYNNKGLVIEFTIPMEINIE